MDISKKIEAIRYEGGVSKATSEEVVIEFPLTIYLKGEQYATLLCTPEHEKELIAGYLYSENVINSRNALKSIALDSRTGEASVEITDTLVLESDLNRKRLVTSGCANNAVFYNAVDQIKLKGRARFDPKPIDFEALLDTMMDMNKASKGFLDTGGVHVSLLTDLKSFHVMREDIGRHNAIDKIVGHVLLNDVDVSDKILMSTGRLSSEMVLKSAKIGIATVVSKSAPTDMAIRIANELGMVLIGFARGKRFNIYSGQL